MYLHYAFSYSMVYYYYVRYMYENRTRWHCQPEADQSEWWHCHRPLYQLKRSRDDATRDIHALTPGGTADAATH